MARLVPGVTIMRSMLATKSLQNPPDEIATGQLETTMLPSPWRRAKPACLQRRQSTGQAADWNCFRRFGGVGREREGETQCGPRVATLHRHGAEPDNPMAMGLSAERSAERRIATGA